MTVTIHLVGIPFVFIVGLIIGAIGGFLFGLRSAGKK